MRQSNWVWIPIATVATSVYAATYFTVEQAQQALFPGAKFTPAFVTLTDAQKREIEGRTDVNVRNTEVRLWKVDGGGFFIVDEVVGKHEFITVAVALNADGSVRGFEIMDYRESYGYEVRDPAWRAQFTGKTAADPLKLERDIKNIGGATLSCRHITDAMKRLLATYEVALK
ncbi:MAG: FMN-binding protein [Burkholderiales bacterium]